MKSTNQNCPTENVQPIEDWTLEIEVSCTEEDSDKYTEYLEAVIDKVSLQGLQAIVLTLEDKEIVKLFEGQPINPVKLPGIIMGVVSRLKERLE